MKIITHPGMSHFDEFTAICLILSQINESELPSIIVERREPTLDELNDPTIWVLDIGQRYEPHLLNFDHHQDLKLDATFVLIAKHLNLNEQLKNIPWWNIKSLLDIKGPVYIQKEMRISTEEFLSLGSPIEKFILEQFEKNPNKLLPLLMNFGKSILIKSQKFIEKMEYYKNCLKLTLDNGDSVLLNESDDIFGLERFIENSEIKFCVSISYDNRGKGWMVYRHNNSKYNFSILENDPVVLFAHKSGFIFKTKEKITLKDLLKIIDKCKIKI